VALKAEHFTRVQLHKNNGFYRFLLHVCELCFFALLADERRGEYRFKDFVRDKVRMRIMFEAFVRKRSVSTRFSSWRYAIRSY
jgi:5-methylcytosine-specific restriction enzyme subunit McrC